MKTALITGASSGIGKETGKALLRESYTVYVAARRTEKMRDLEALGAHPVAMDITNEEQVLAAVERITAERGSIDVLVNNAGFGLYGAVEDTTIEDARYQFEVNLFGPARLTQLVLPGMRARRAGTIVNVSSMGGKVYTPLGAWYHATKHALEGWSDCLRLELEPFGIRVVIIEPGIIETEFAEVMAGPLIERSGASAYAPVIRRMMSRGERYTRPGAMSPPSVVAATIVRALRARRPRTRYPVGRLARPAIAIRKWLGDRIYDRIVNAAL